MTDRKIGTKPCSYCEGGEAHRIRIIDKAHGGTHRDLEYTLPGKSRSFWKGEFPVEGRVLSYMCDDCGHIMIFGSRRRRQLG